MQTHVMMVRANRDHQKETAPKGNDLIDTRNCNSPTLAMCRQASIWHRARAEDTHPCEKGKCGCAVVANVVSDLQVNSMYLASGKSQQRSLWQHEHACHVRRVVCVHRSRLARPNWSSACEWTRQADKKIRCIVSSSNAAAVRLKLQGLRSNRLL